MTLVPFRDYRPSARTDAPWTGLRIYESVTRTGPWTLIDTKTLSPVDVTPANPQLRSFQTSNATLDTGWYRVDFTDLSGNVEPTSPVRHVAGLLPSVDDVAALLRDRTVAAGSRGEELGTFTAGTRPTADEVEGLITWAANLTLPQFPDALAPQVLDGLRALITLRAAIKVEESYFSEQVDADSRRVDGFRLDATSLAGVLVPTAEENVPGAVSARGYGSVPIETVMTVPVTDPAGLLP